MPPTWHLMLANRVLKADPVPERILLVSTVGNLLEVTPASENMFRQMTSHMTPEDEPELMARMGFTRPTASLEWWMAVRRATVQESVLEGTRDLAIGLFWGSWSDPGTSGRELAERSYAKVFDDRMAADALLRVLPIAQVRRERQPAALEDGFLPLLADACAAAGTELVLALPPQRGDEAVGTPEQHAAVVGWAEARGIRLLDLRDSVGPKWFFDDYHLGPPGRRKFTSEMVGLLDGVRAEAPGRRKSKEVVAEVVDAEPTPTEAPPAISEDPSEDSWPPTNARVEGASLSVALGPAEGAACAWRRKVDLPAGAPLVVEGLTQGEPGEGCTGTWWWDGDALVLATEDPDVSVRWRGAERVRWGEHTGWLVPPGASVLWDFPTKRMPPEAETHLRARAVRVGPGGQPLAWINQRTLEGREEADGVYLLKHRFRPRRLPRTVTITAPDDAPLVVTSLGLEIRE
jgi:hypothetical protein